MKKKQILILAVVLAALAVVYAAMSFANKKAQEKEKAQEESKIIQVADLGEIAAFSYETAEQEPLHFEKKGDEWICTDDKEMELEQTYPSEIADSFASLTAFRKMEEIDELEDYGLKEPAYTVTLQPEDGEEMTFYVGNVTGDEYYLQIKGEEEAVYTVSSSAVMTLDHSLEDMKKTEEGEDAEADS